jgi:hypothetical protein
LKLKEFPHKTKLKEGISSPRSPVITSPFISRWNHNRVRRAAGSTPPEDIHGYDFFFVKVEGISTQAEGNREMLKAFVDPAITSPFIGREIII